MESSPTTDVRRDPTWKVLGSAIEVHRVLGPGLLERTYRACLDYQLRADGMRVMSEVPVPICYKGITLDASYRADLIIEDAVLVELKAVEQILPVHCVQVLTYLRLTGLPVGLLIDFNSHRLKAGVRRFANTLGKSRA